MEDFEIEPSEREERFKRALFNHQIDPTGALLLPGCPEKCEGNGEHPDYECCCDECDYYLECFPEVWEEMFGEKLENSSWSPSRSLAN